MFDRAEDAIPNVFYDLLVFLSPSILFVAGILVGIGPWFVDAVAWEKVDIGALDVIVVILLLILLGYEYGRIVETLSSPVIGDPIRFLQRKGWLFTHEDFCVLLTDAVKTLPISQELPAARQGSKWTIYFFALGVMPGIGRDLLKRYAWEKLARSSACTYVLLTVISTGVWIADLFSTYRSPFVGWGFGSPWYTGIVFVLLCTTIFEYYQRNIWNNDLLIKTLPVLLYMASTNKPKNSD